MLTLEQQVSINKLNSSSANTPQQQQQEALNSSSILNQRKSSTASSSIPPPATPLPLQQQQQQLVTSVGQSVFVITTNAATGNQRIYSRHDSDHNSLFTGSVNSFQNLNNQPQQVLTSSEGEGGAVGAGGVLDNNSNGGQLEEGVGVGEEQIVVEQTSKLGVLVQTKVLEEKMQSFITLMNENQLNRGEQKQVYDSIRADYESLIKNYQHVKKNDSSGLLPNELDMDM